MRSHSCKPSQPLGDQLQSYRLHELGYPIYFAERVILSVAIVLVFHCSPPCFEWPGCGFLA